jgi:hypothetical protein
MHVFNNTVRLNGRVQRRRRHPAAITKLMSERADGEMTHHVASIGCKMLQEGTTRNNAEQSRLLVNAT